MLSNMHRAVIEGDVEAVSRLLSADSYHMKTDSLGFSPKELAAFLGQYHCWQMLGGKPTGFVKLQKRGHDSPDKLSIAEFEAFFKIVYRQFLTFHTYDELKAVIRNCPYILRFPWLAKENYELASKYAPEVAHGDTAPVYIKWIDPMLKYGLFADEDLPENTFVGEYAGYVRRLYRKNPDQNAYCFQYPTRFWSMKYYAIDSMTEGNVLRFANHSNHPTMEPYCLVDRGLLHTIFLTNQPVKKGTQLTFDYGDDYWVRRQKI